MRRHRVKVLLHLKGNVLRQNFHGVDHAAAVEAQGGVLNHSQKFAITLLKQEFALLLQNAYVDVALLDVFVAELHDVD